MSVPPAPTRPPLARPLHSQVMGLALVLVLGLHFLLLGDSSLHQLWTPAPAAADTAPLLLAARILPPATPPAVIAAARPANKPVQQPSKDRQPAWPAALDPAAVPEATRTPTPPAPLAETSTIEPAGARLVAPVQHFTFPPPVQLDYDVLGETDDPKNIVAATIVWKRDDAHYESSLLVTKFGFRQRQWTSQGALTATGLAPVRFGAKGVRSSEVAAHFVWDDNKVIFSANTPQTDLTSGAQDHLSMFMQLASLLAGQPDRYTADTTIAFQSVGPRQSEVWTFVVSPEETMTVPGGTLQVIKLTREANGDYSTKAEVWLAPQLAYLPARIRLTESNGKVLDIVWTGGRPP